MPRQQLSYSIPTKFSFETLKHLREAAVKNERTLSGEIRYRINQSLQPKDSPDAFQSQKEEKNQVHR